MAVLNKHHGNIPSGAVYIGRGSVWGNPYSHLPSTKGAVLVSSREEAVWWYTVYLNQAIADGRITVHQLASLHGKDLVCYCAPKSCHGDVLAHYAAHAHQHLITNT